MVKKLVKKIALFYKILTYILQLFCLYICCLKFKVKITQNFTCNVIKFKLDKKKPMISKYYLCH